MKIERNYNLSKLNTFGISVNSKFFVEIGSEADLKELFNTEEFRNNKKLFLGGGSNVLFTKDFDGLVILNKLKGITPIEIEVGAGVEKDFTYIRAMGGEIWHDLVVFTADHGLWGIENLSLIPGTVGAAPMQNIGAYGAELKNVLESVEALNIDTGEKRIFSKEECEFGYRDSVFKNSLRDKYFISSITLKLSRTPKPDLSYKILADFLEKNKIAVNGPKDISDAVSSIRKSKLPDPGLIPNAGSFFKNVFVKAEQLKKLQEIYPDIPHFNEPSGAEPARQSAGGVLAGRNGKIKIPAAWLIERCGPTEGTSWKGYRIGNVGVHYKQALVLVNYGGASGEEIKNLSDQIVASVFLKFGLKLVPEVNLI